jgi:uncharacterized membrane protein YphA (DoxX/SURF4 family)
MKTRVKARIKKAVTATACLLAAAILIYAGTSTIRRHMNSDVYSDGTQTVTLFDDGRFTAELLLHMQRSGTYEKRETAIVTAIWFHIAGEIDIGWLKDDVLQLPVNWEIDDNETFLPKR